MESQNIFGHTLIRVDTVDSTNNFATKLLKEGLCHSGTVIMSDNQTKGRGQRGNEWISEPSANLTITLVHKVKSLLAKDIFNLNMAVSIAIINTLDDLGELSLFVKWPNDIFINNKKVAGILIENNLIGNKVDLSLIGIGLNINQKKFSSIRATSLSKTLNRDFKLLDVLSALLKNLDAALYKLEQKDKKWLKEEYMKYLYRLDQEAEFLVRNRLVRGIITDINKEGQLVFNNLSENKMEVFSIQEIKHIY